MSSSPIPSLSFPNWQIQNATYSEHTKVLWMEELKCTDHRHLVNTTWSICFSVNAHCNGHKMAAPDQEQHISPPVIARTLSYYKLTQPNPALINHLESNNIIDCIKKGWGLFCVFVECVCTYVCSYACACVLKGLRKGNAQSQKIVEYGG